MMYHFRNKRDHLRTTRYIAEQTPFHFVRLLGEGAYGVTYLLQHPETQQYIVLKRLKAKHLTKKSRAKFQQEIVFLQQLRDLHVPRFMKQGMIEQSPFYTMSYVEGETFEQAIFSRNLRFSIEETIYFTQMLLTLVEQLHTAHVVHRDLRIPNIILKNGQLTIIDFGLATTIDLTFSLARMKDPKKAPHPVSDLYAVGHFMLFLLYSQYEPTTKRSKSWQQELQLPSELQTYIERLLTIQEPFSTAQKALHALQQLS